jgi:hypothetical protein
MGARVKGDRAAAMRIGDQEITIVASVETELSTGGVDDSWASLWISRVGPRRCSLSRWVAKNSPQVVLA